MFRDEGLGFGVWGLEFGVWGLGFEVWGLRFGVCANQRFACRKHSFADSLNTLISEAPRSGPLSLAPVSAKELKERAFQGVL